MAKNKETVEDQSPPTEVAETNKDTAITGGGSYADYAGQGYEDTTQDDYSIAFLSVLQALSPQVTGDEALDNAKAGMLFNTVTGDVFDGKTGIVFVPAHRAQVAVEWTPREQGGGYVGQHDLKSEIVLKAQSNKNDKGVPIADNGNELVQTAYIYGIIVHEDGRLEPAVLGLVSTKLKVYRHLMTKLNQFTIKVGDRKVCPPIFAHRLRITTKSEKNAKGSFYNIAIGADGESLSDSLLKTDDELFIEAAKLRQMVMSGDASANHDSAGKTGEGTDDVPF